MDTSKTTNEDQPHQPPRILAGYLASALNMEDEISIATYIDYLNPKNWPDGIKPEIFEKITTRLNTLIEDTDKHKKIIAALVKKYGQNN